jgi:SpoVK/Ycf46/Vps4 family AAA+-type ATPase
VGFGGDMFGERRSLLTFHRRPELTRDDVVLPGAVMDTVERQVVGVGRQRARLLASGQHLKRGLLLYGPPGTGKTHTIRYLLSRLTGTTVVLLSGNALHLVAQACSIARSLQPSMVVIEDVDLIAEERGMHPGQNPMLFQLLNEMDGLAEDTDVVFVLTTNRADLLEPALAARPGRVDQAVELELPDADARRALLHLYRGRLDLDLTGTDDVIDRTEGVTASFLKELLRRAAVVGAEGDGPRELDGEAAPIAVRAEHLAAALDELLATRNAMTRALLGSVEPID